MSYRHIKPYLDAYVGSYFTAQDDETTMERIADIVRWHQQGVAYREVEDALSQIFVQLCQSEYYGEHKAIPSPISLKEMAKHLTDVTEDVLNKPVPANLYGESDR